MDGVGDEILDDLLQPDAVAPDGQEGAGVGMEVYPLLVGFALAGSADGGGIFVEDGAIFVEQDLFLLQLCREKEVFRQRCIWL